MTQNSRPRETWSSRFGVILAVTGSAVGLGNFLRFPGLAAKYEGGAFMIPYFIAFFLLGLPMAWVEWSIGRYGGARGFNSAAGIYRSIWKNRLSPYFGALAMLVPVGIYMYYVVIEGWCLAYAWYMASGQLNFGATGSEQYGNFFSQFTGLASDGANYSLSSAPAVIFIAICFVLNFVLIYRGLTKGIEWFCKWAMPALVICALIVLGRVLTLDHITSGLGFMWNPRTESMSFWKAMADGNMWLDAAGQIFFSLSVGFGIIINYASYVGRNDDIALSALTSAAGNEFCEVGLGGMISIPASFIFMGTAAVAGTFSLGFVVLPQVFATMPLGQIVGTLFFFLLFLAALTSSLSMLQPAIALMEEGLNLNRKTSVAVLGFITVLGAAFVLYFSKDLLALDTFDFWVGTFCIYVLSVFQIVLFGWFLGIKRGYEEIQRGAEIRVPPIWMFIIKYISPLYLLGVFAFWIYQQVITPRGANRFAQIIDNSVVMASVGFLILVGILFCAFVAQSVRHWKKQESSGQQHLDVGDFGGL
ncbi:MAG: sodium-dependent transporter [Phycisphaerales bacterium]|nr:sodium-dependent transporter [Phycisphaerales bacterium]